MRLFWRGFPQKIYRKGAVIMNRTSEHLLYRLGLSPCSACFWHTCAALDIVLQDPQALICLSKCVYPAIAEKFGVTPAAVESNLRRAILLCWRRSRPMLEELVGSKCPQPPTIRQVLAGVLMHR